jgi:hypothetical protein
MSQAHESLSLRVQDIWDADVYRDGGSYGFCFDSDDGRWYEFFLKTKAFEQPSSESHYPPVIYLEGCNSGQVTQSLTWQEAKSVVAPLRYDNARFAELVEIVMNEGRKADNK